MRWIFNLYTDSLNFVSHASFIHAMIKNKFTSACRKNIWLTRKKYDEEEKWGKGGHMAASNTAAGKKKKNRSDTLMHAAYTALQDKISIGLIRPGTLISEGQLAKELDMSRTPVREALVALEKEGIVEIHCGVGALVKPLAARTALYHIPQKEMEKFRTKFEALLKLADAPEEERIRSYVEVDSAFHLMITDYSENPFIAPMMQLTQTNIRRLAVRSFKMGYQRYLNSVQEHLEMIHIMEEGNVPLFCEKLRKHLSWGIQGFLEIPDSSI